MMTFDQILNNYVAYIRSREVSDNVEWTERKELETDDRRSKTETD